MPIKIGFLNFTALDPPGPTEYAAYKKLERRLEPDNHVKSLFQSHPTVPDIRTEPPALFRTPDARVYKLAAELAPYMDEFQDFVLDKSRIRERLKSIERYRFNGEIAEFKYFRHIDLLQAWIVELLFERVYRRAGRYQQIYEKVAKHEWMETRQLIELQREQRIRDAKIFPELHQKELAHPYRFEIKQPNEKKALQKLDEHVQGNRRLMTQAKAQMLQLRQLMHDMLFDDIRLHLRNQFIDQRGHADERSRAHLRDVLQAFDKAWTHAWESRDAFKKLVRHAICEQAELYPRLFRKALTEPYELDIREPNEFNFKEKFQEHLRSERQLLNLVKLEETAARQHTKNIQQELAAYRNSTADHLDEKIETRNWEEHVLIDRSDQRNLEARDHRVDAMRVESQGYQLLAGRMVPQPKFGIETVFPSAVPLALGIHGSPAAPEHVTPTPLQLPPLEQRQLWNKVRSTQDEEKRQVLGENHEAWQRKTQGIRQNLAAIEYGEQKTKELVRVELAPRAADSTPRPESELDVEAVDPVKPSDPAATIDSSRIRGKMKG